MAAIHKRHAWWLGVILFVLIVLLVTMLLTRKVKAPGSTVILNNHIFTVTVADTPAVRAQGLSDTPSLAKNHGMLFVFQTPDRACFWMKDMRYNLDILWFDANNKLVKLENNLSP